MSRKLAYCGYADILAHLNCRSAADIRAYNDKVGGLNAGLYIPEERWQKSKNKLRDGVNDL